MILLIDIFGTLLSTGKYTKYLVQSAPFDVLRTGSELETNLFKEATVSPFLSKRDSKREGRCLTF